MKSCRSKSICILSLKGVGSCCIKSRIKVRYVVVDEFGMNYSSTTWLLDSGGGLLVRSTGGSAENLT